MFRGHFLTKKQTTMLICDGKPVEMKAPNVSSSKFVNAKIKELRENIGFPMRFNLPKGMSNEIAIYDKATEVARPSTEFAQGVRLKLTANYKNPRGGLEQWTYYTDMKMSKEGRVQKYLPRWHELTHVNVFNESDAELVFFLVYISGHCESIEGITDQNSHKKREYLILEDRAREARKSAKKRRAEAVVSHILYDPDRLSDEDLKILAKSYYIPDVDQVKELDIIRDNIYRIVIKSSDKNALDDFMERANIDEITKMMALITDAIDKKVIFLKKDSFGQSWKFLDADGKDGDTLHKVEPTARPKKSLLNKLMSNPTLLEKLRLSVETDSSDE